MRINSSPKVWSLFLPLYLLTLPFTALWQLPLFGQKFQLSELVFLVALIYIIFTRRQIWEGTKTDWALLCLPLAYALAALLHPGKAAVLEVVGMVYLYGVYLLVKYSAGQISKALMRRAVDYLSMLLIGISLLSFLLPMMGAMEYGYLAERKWLPFIGWVPRVSGFTATPNMWASTIFFAGFLQFGLWRTEGLNKYGGYIAIGLMTSAALTFSKSLVAAVGVGVIIFGGNRWLKVLGGAVIGTYLFLCHWLIIPTGSQDAPVTYFSADDCHTTGSFDVCATTYLKLKRIALQAFWDSNGLGVGGGQFSNYVASQKEIGKYPPDLLSYDPHSTYFGILAEAGVMGILALTLIIVVLVKYLIKNDNIKHIYYAGVLTYLCLLGLEAWVMDVLNFRMLWVAVGFLIGIVDEEK